MPFCRKCGRRLPEYSESCSDCGTSTTAPIIKIKKTSAAHSFKPAAKTKIAKAVIPKRHIIVSVKVIAQPKKVKPVVLAKVVIKPKSFASSKHVTPAVVYPEHEIIKSNLSIEEDILENPKDYEMQIFDFDFKCANGHFWRAGVALPVSNGKAYCPECGERLTKPKPKKRRSRYRS
jgi:rRNA maturation protein Nop10